MDVPLNDTGSVSVDDGYRTQRPAVYAAVHMGAIAAAAMVLDLSDIPTR